MPTKISPMNPPGYQVRRATVEDLPELCRLWEEAYLPVAELKERFREFQVACDTTGLFLGGIGLQIAGNQGILHSEVFANPNREDEYRDPIWERLLGLSRNHGLVRLWTQEDAPYWHHVGFKAATEDQLQRLPPHQPDIPGKWLCLALRDESAAQKSAEQEFTVFMMQQKEETERLIQRAKFIKNFAAAIVLILAAIIMAMAGFLMFRRALGSGRPSRR